MSQDSTKRTILVALGICLFCSFFVSTAAVTLKAIQNRNIRLDKVKNILVAGDLYESGSDIEKTYQEKVEAIVIDMNTGAVLDAASLDVELDVQNFDVATTANDPELGEDISRDKDTADIRRRPKYMVAYLVKNGDDLEKLILPVYGKGLWSTMYGFIALNNDLATVSGITFYAHGETPGLGGEIDNPRWKNIWKGKQLYDENGNLSIEVIKGQVDPTGASASHQIDGLSGSTLTTRGLDSMTKYWLGENGYGTFLKNMREDS